MHCIALLVAALLSAPALAQPVPTFECGRDGMKLTISQNTPYGGYFINANDYDLQLENAACPYTSAANQYSFAWASESSVCGNQVQADKNYFEIRNTFHAYAKGIQVGGVLIINRPHIHIELVCKIYRDGSVTASVLCPVPDVAVAGVAAVSVNIQLQKFTDAAYTDVHADTDDTAVGMPLYYQVAMTPALSWLEIDNVQCYATAENAECRCLIADFSATDLADCGKQGTVTCTQAPPSVARFWYTLFFFAGHDHVLVECDTTLKCKGNCDYSCSGGRRAADSQSSLKASLRFRKESSTIVHGQ